MQLEPSPGSLGRFSACLHALYGSPDDSVGFDWTAARLDELRALVPFERAWWGECSSGEAGEAPMNWLHGSIGLAASFAQEWNAIAAADEFAQASMQALGQVCRSSGHDSAGAAIEPFSRRHDLFHAMAVTLELPGSGLMFFVSLYRGETSSPFEPIEELLLQEYGGHLARCWHDRLQRRLRDAPASGSERLALCEPSGEVLYLGAELARALRQAVPGWQGAAMPTTLVARFPERPATVRLGRLALELAACGELVAVSLAGGTRRAELSPRERAAALLYAQGHSYKAIAVRLSLSPATVRTYLRDAYLQLGVRNKVELGARLSQA